MKNIPLRSTSETGDLKFSFCPDEPDLLKVTRQKKQWLIQYGRKTLAARGVAHVLAGQTCCEKPFFTTFGILLDCPRGNAVTPQRFKFWLRRLALMGYNTVMIYIKDAMRGALPLSSPVRSGRTS